MWWSRTGRRLFVAGGAALVLTGCGFVPVHGPGGAGGAMRHATAITAPRTEDGYRLLSTLEDRLGRSDSARWHLAVTLEMTETAAAYGADATIRRNTLVGEAGWRLSDIAGERLIGEGVARAFAGHDAGGNNTVALRAGAIDARERLAVMLADAIVAQILTLDPEG